MNVFQRINWRNVAMGFVDAIVFGAVIVALLVMICISSGTPIEAANEAVSGMRAGGVIMIMWAFLDAMVIAARALRDYLKRGKLVRGDLGDPLRIVCATMLLVPNAGGESAIQRFTIHPLLELAHQLLGI